MAVVTAKVKARPVARNLLQAQIGGEFFGGCGASDSTVKSAQQGLLDGDIAYLAVYGLDGDGDAVLDVRMDFVTTGSSEVLVDVREGEALLASYSRPMAGAVVHVANQIKAKGLKPDFRYGLAPHVYADPDKYRAVMEKLGLRDGTVIQRKPGASERKAANVTRRDGGIGLGLSIWR